MRRALVSLVAALSLFRPSLLAQVPPGAPGQIASRSSAQKPETGTARIRGRVTAASTGEAVSKARVTVLDATNAQWTRSATGRDRRRPMRGLRFELAR
jgi:hypothetical protein